MIPPPKVSLIQSPTPLHRLDRASADLGIDLWIKRDDLTGLALGGNKGRKLEYLMAEVLASGAKAVVTCGAMQSNFIRQLGAACAMLGVKCIAAVMQTPYEFSPPHGEGLRRDGGNVLLDQWLGVDLRVYPDGTWDELYKHSEQLAQALESQGMNVYRIPIGGSSPLGAYAFYEAGLELQAQSLDAFDTIVFASSSGSTQVGLTHAFRSSKTQVLGVCSDPEPDIAEDFAILSESLAPIIGQPAIPSCEFKVRTDMVGPGYGVPSGEGNEAIRYLSQTEGIFLDPVYSGKAFAAVMDMARDKGSSARVCFWHTGGVPNLFVMKGSPVQELD